MEKKAEEYKANSIRINKETGIFHKEIEATGYRCVNDGSKKVAKK